MSRQRPIPSRRAYNRWVADETLEDFALRFTPPSARRWSETAIANTALGSSSFMALEAIGGLLTLRYGFATTAWAIALTALVIFVTATPIAVAAARRGIDIDLLTRGAGFGYLGSTATSLIYAAFTFIFFALEASILAGALTAALGVPHSVGSLLAAAAIVPMVTLGIAFIGRFQRATQGIWVALTVLAVSAVLASDRSSALLTAWVRTAGETRTGGWLALGAASSVIVALIAQIGEQVDYLRFMPEAVPGRRWRWWAAVIAGGPGWIVPGVAKLFAGSLLAVCALRAGVGADAASQPVTMYARAFDGLTRDPGLALALATVLIVVAQLKINVTNAYAGSIAWSNFFSRLTRRHPGRVVWVVFNVAIALSLMEMGVYPAIQAVLGCFSVVACAWVGALFSDLALVRPLGLAPRQTDFKRAHLHDVNPVGAGSMAAASLGGFMALAGYFGPVTAAFAPFVALLVSVAGCPALAFVTGGRAYLARKPRRSWAVEAPPCTVCGMAFAGPDMAFCPAYGGAICSLCCTLDARCRDACKPHARLSAQVARWSRGMLPPAGADGRMGTALPRFVRQFALACFVIGVMLGSIGMAVQGQAARAAVEPALGRAFVVLSIVAGVVVWLLTLAQESGEAAIEESRRQTALLEEEMAAHRRTDADLHRATAVAEAANLAKSRFVVGVAHELRTPLNSLLGYAQLLEVDPSVPEGRRETVRTIRRSGEHLARLIEGLLDISKIEAGRIHIERRPVGFEEFLHQIAEMFRMQAEARGIGFTFERPALLPPVVRMDETRLRQVLINLLSNAVKFTERGSVGMRVERRGEVTSFDVTDSGPGIAVENLERIFEPFERVGATASGIGLGLTISRLLANVMGGELTVSSEVGVGSRFRLRVLLSSVAGEAAGATVPRMLRGYEGPRRRLVAADDDATHRALLDAVLRPLGFELLSVPDAAGCLRLAEEARAGGAAIDAFLLDVSMRSESGRGADGSDLDGWALARRLREAGWTVPVIVVSAHPEEYPTSPAHDAFLPKPINIQALQATLGRLLKLQWIEERGAVQEGTVAGPVRPASASVEEVAELRRLARIGHVGALKGRVGALREARPGDPVLERLDASLRAFRLGEAESILEELGR